MAWHRQTQVLDLGPPPGFFLGFVFGAQQAVDLAGRTLRLLAMLSGWLAFIPFRPPGVRLIAAGSVFHG
jgi:hypothetical protein